STYFLDKYGARECTACQRKYAFQSAIGTVFSSFCTSAKNFGSVTLSDWMIPMMPLVARYGFHSNDGAILLNCATVIVCARLCGSRRSTRVSDAFASAVSMRIAVA